MSNVNIYIYRYVYKLFWSKLTFTLFWTAESEHIFPNICDRVHYNRDGRNWEVKLFVHQSLHFLILIAGYNRLQTVFDTYQYETI